jgi:acyl-CoA reductase-like NAD-dependent aldehyde dehydrogenase
MSKALVQEIREAAEADLKHCHGCNKTLESTKFSKNKTRKDGLATQCKECHKNYVRARRKTDVAFLEKAREYSRKWQSKDPVARAKRIKQWNTLNKARRNYLTTKRYTRKKNACPLWLTERHKKEIENFYWLTQDLRVITGENYEVDHIIPLQGKQVCGLHVPWNLQVLPSNLNRKKSNSHE